MDRILINDLTRHSRSLAIEIHGAIERVVASGRYVLGPECSEFEREFADFCGTGYCIGVANGTDALELALRALGIGHGKRVANVANAGCYTTTALDLVGATPIFIDVEPTSRLMDLATLASLVETGEIDAVAITHLFGLMHDSIAARAIADRAGIPLIEDCAQAHGARRNGQRAGSIGHVSCFSFYPTKNLGALGDGGAVLTNDPELARKLVALRQYGWTEKYTVVSRGGRNSRLDELQAAVLRAKLGHLDRLNARRREVAQRLSEGIRHPRITCPRMWGEECVAHLYVVECDDRDALRAHLAAAGIMTEVHYPIPDHLQAPVVTSGVRPSLPVTERLARTVLTLPCFPELTADETDRIIERINAW